MTTQAVEAQVINPQVINDDELEQIQGGFLPFIANPHFIAALNGGFTTGFAKAILDS